MSRIKGAEGVPKGVFCDSSYFFQMVHDSRLAGISLTYNTNTKYLISILENTNFKAH